MQNVKGYFKNIFPTGKTKNLKIRETNLAKNTQVSQD